MPMTLTSPITGGAQTGFTSPTYTIVQDTATDFNRKQYSVTALGGTQTGVTTASASAPFNVTLVRPKQLATLQATPNMTSVLGPVAKNRYLIHGRKAVTVLSGQPLQTADVRCEIAIPAGADVNDAANVRALLSAVIGALSQMSAGLGDTSVTGIA